MKAMRPLVTCSHQRYVSACSGAPIRYARARFSSKVDEFVPRTQHVNLRKAAKPPLMN